MQQPMKTKMSLVRKAMASLKTEHKNMDLHNNEVGRILAMQNPGLTEDALANLIYSEVNKENSSFIWLHDIS